MAEFDGKAVMARQGNLLVSAFHPELMDDPGIHRYFIEMIK
jgi:5'-phosphate synthase pdxT subunit